MENDRLLECNGVVFAAEGNEKDNKEELEWLLDTGKSNRTVKIKISIIVAVVSALVSACSGFDQRNSVVAETVESEAHLEKSFSFDGLQWGMSRQEVLDCLGLSEDDALISEKEIPAEEKMAPRTLVKMRCEGLAFRDTVINAEFTFVTENTEPEWDIGMSRMRLEVTEDISGMTGKIKEDFEKSPMNAGMKWEELSEEQRGIMKDYFQASYLGNSAGTMEMLGIRAVPVQNVEDGTDGIYYSISFGGEMPAVWNCYAVGTE